MSALLPLALVTGLVWSCVLALAASPLVPVLAVWAICSIYGPGTVTWEWAGKTVSPDRLAIGWLAAFVLIRTVVHRGQHLEIRDRSLLSLGLFGLLCLVQLTLYQWNPLPWDEMPPGIRLSYLLGMPIVMYLAVQQRGGLSRREVNLLLVVLWGFGTYLAATAIFEKLGVTALVFPRHILRPRQLYLGRPVGPFLSTPLLGTMLLICLAATILFLRRVGGILRLVCLVTVPLFAAAILFTQTRSVWLGCVGVLWILLFAMSRHSLRYGLICVGIVAAVIGAVVAGAEFLNPQRIEGAELVEFSFLQRLALLDGAITLFLKRPIFGWGFGQFERAVNESVGGGVLGFWATGAAIGLSSHNLALRVLAETGLVGAFLFGSVWWMWLKRAWLLTRSRNDVRTTVGLLTLCAAAAYWSEGMFHDPSYQPAGTLTVALLAGLCHALGKHTRPAGPRWEPVLAAAGSQLPVRRHGPLSHATGDFAVQTLAERWSGRSDGSNRSGRSVRSD